MEKNEEIIKPIEKEVKRPIMKFISKIATPLAVLILAIWGFIICCYCVELEEAKSQTAQDWKEYAKYDKDDFLMGSYAGYSSYNDYKEYLEEKYFEEHNTNTLLIAGIGIGVVAFISKNSYKKGQEE